MADYEFMPYDGSGDNPLPNKTVLTNTTPPAAAPKTSGSQIEQWYNQYLGHGMGAGTDEQKGIWNQWYGMDPNAVESGIKNSGEAQAFTASKGTGPIAHVGGAQLQQPTFVNTAQPIASAQGTNPQLTALRNLLMQKATQSEYVDPNSPEVRAQTDAYGADITRAGNSFLSRQAEKGGPFGDMGAATRSVGEKAGQATAGYRASLVQRLGDARRTQIAQALGGLGSTLGTDEATRLRQEDQALARNQFGAGTTQQAFEDQYRTIFG